MRRALALAAALAIGGCAQPQQPPGSAPTRAPTTVLRDTLIASDLRARLLAEYPDAAAGVGVSVADAVVTLRGTVRDAETRRHVIDDAERTTYVQGVIDRLRVDSHSRFSGKRVRNVVDRIRVAVP